MDFKKITACILTFCALTALCAVGAFADTVSMSAFGGTPTWYHLVEVNGNAYYKSYGTNQLVDSDISDDSSVYLRIDRTVDKSQFNSLGDFVQVDIYLTKQAVAPAFGNSAPFTGSYWSNRFVGIYPTSSNGAPISYYDYVSAVNRDYKLTSASLCTISLIVSKADFLSHCITTLSKTMR